jgi:hypothetical protein
MGKSLLTLSDTVSIFEKRFGLKIVGKPCEGKPHARFDEGLLGRPKAAPAAYSTSGLQALLTLFFEIRIPIKPTWGSYPSVQ